MSRSASPDVPIVFGWLVRTVGMIGCGYLMARLGRGLFDDIAYEAEYATNRQRCL